ncbi:MAG: hypothetical protein AB8G77_13965 [Rhodothermales bacterium]
MKYVKFLLPYLFLLACIVPATFLTTTTAVAQRDTTGTLLPDISPREVEIKGELQIAFPSLIRQPLIGFNPPPRVPELPEGRRPFIEDYKLASADLPNTPLGQPDPPQVSSLGDLKPINGEFEASAGRYLSRIIRARLSASLNNKSSLYSRIDYQGTEGYFLEDDATFPDLRNPFDGLYALLGYQSISPKTGWGIELDGNVDSYTLFGTNLLENDSISNQVVLPDRNGLSGNMEFWLQSQAEATVDTEFRLKFGGTRYQTDLFDNALNELPRLDQREKRLTSVFNLGVPFSVGEFLLMTEVSGAGIDDESVFDFSSYYLNIGTGFKFEIGPKFNIQVAGRYLGTSLISAGQDEFSSYFSADAQINLYPAPGVAIFARNKPGIDRNTLWEVFRKNPYISDMPSLQSTIRPIDAEAGFTLFKGNVQLAVKAGYIQSPNFLFFESEADQPNITGYNYRRGIFNYAFEDVEILHAEGDVSISFPSGIHAKFGVSVREAQLTDSDVNVPYYSPIVSENMISYTFAEKRMMLQLLTTYHSSRFRSRFDTIKVKDYFDIDLTYSYNLHAGLGMIVRLENILGNQLEHWQHYPEAPMTVSAGLRVLW